ncbi:MAG: putative prephenate dehydrogenase [Thermoleophilia bacterium]|jgi:prephenate dehydrogenase|nr:putative prephenate dehydrogenase [Thermoleophilia bacterium]
MHLRDATVAIVGLGLMGGSLGLALAGRCACRIGIDVEAAHGMLAVELGAVDEATSLEAAAARADIVVLAMPVRRMPAEIAQLGALVRPGAVITDLGSTKGEVCAAMDALPEHVEAIGGHPMCGRELSGIGAGDAFLYNDARWVLVPTDRTTEHARTIVRELVHAAGAHELTLERTVHDRAVALASHTPYVIAQALMQALLERDPHGQGATSELAATGFRGATRLAAGSVDMWHDILLTNGEQVRGAVGDLRDQLTAIEGLLDDEAGLRELLQRGHDASFVRDGVPRAGMHAGEGSA